MASCLSASLNRRLLTATLSFRSLSEGCDLMDWKAFLRLLGSVSVGKVSMTLPPYLGRSFGGWSARWRGFLRAWRGEQRQGYRAWDGRACGLYQFPVADGKHISAVSMTGCVAACRGNRIVFPCLDNRIEGSLGYSRAWGAIRDLRYLDQRQ
jgi:hypothetical protein